MGSRKSVLYVQLSSNPCSAGYVQDLIGPARHNSRAHLALATSMTAYPGPPPTHCTKCATWSHAPVTPLTGKKVVKPAPGLLPHVEIIKTDARCGATTAASRVCIDAGNAHYRIHTAHESCNALPPHRRLHELENHDRCRSTSTGQDLPVAEKGVSAARAV